MTSIPPRHPFPNQAHVPPHGTDPSGQVHVWFCDPLGIVTVSNHHSHITRETVLWLAGPITDRLLGLHRVDPRPLLFIHDARSVHSHESSARAEGVRWARRLGAHRIERIDFVLKPETPRLVTMGCGVTAAVLRVAGISCRVLCEHGAIHDALSGVRALEDY